MADNTDTRTSRSDSPICSSGSERFVKSFVLNLPMILQSSTVCDKKLLFFLCCSNEDVFEKETVEEPSGSPNRKQRTRKISERGGKTKSKTVYTVGEFSGEHCKCMLFRLKRFLGNASVLEMLVRDPQRKTWC